MKETIQANFKNSLSDFFSSLKDPRRINRGNYTYLLSDILLLTILGIMCGADKWETIHIFGESQQRWLKQYGNFSNGILSTDTMRRVFSAIDSRKFNDCFISWVNHLCIKTKGEIVAIDGKTVKGAKFEGMITPHIVSAFASENQLCLGQLKVDDKSNEITAIPELLKLLDIQDNIVTIDAMGCQAKIVDQIIESQANYIIAVKDNQPSLASDIRDTITLTKPNSTHVQENFGHGRIEKRTCEVFSNLRHIESQNKWTNLSSVIRITSEVVQKSSGLQTTEERFYISDINDADTINKGIRSHWSVENTLHWTLDVTFQEDASKKRMGNQVENFNILSKIVFSILKKDKSTKLSLKNRRMKAALDFKYRDKLMNMNVF